MDKQEYLKKAKRLGVWKSLYDLGERIDLLAANLKELNDFLMGDETEDQ